MNKIVKSFIAVSVVLLAAAIFDGCSDGKEYYSNGQVKQEASYKDNVLHGNFVKYYENGKIDVQGSYKNGKKDGRWVHYCNAGKGSADQLCEEKFYSEGRLEGIEKNWYENGQLKFEGEYKHNKRTAKSKYWYDNGQIMYEFNDGYSKGWAKNGDLALEERFENNAPAGLWIRYELDEKSGERGKLLGEARFENGKGVGVWKLWSRIKKKLMEIDCGAYNCNIEFYREAGSSYESEKTFDSRKKRPLR